MIALYKRGMEKSGIWSMLGYGLGGDLLAQLIVEIGFLNGCRFLLERDLILNTPDIEGVMKTRYLEAPSKVLPLTILLMSPKHSSWWRALLT
jgi:hypothetical protein